MTSETYQALIDGAIHHVTVDLNEDRSLVRFWMRGFEFPLTPDRLESHELALLSAQIAEREPSVEALSGRRRSGAMRFVWATAGHAFAVVAGAAGAVAREAEMRANGWK